MIFGSHWKRLQQASRWGFFDQQQKENLKDSRKRDKNVFFVVYQALDGEGFEKISSVTSANNAWEKFQTSYKEKRKWKRCISKL